MRANVAGGKDGGHVPVDRANRPDPSPAPSPIPGAGRPASARPETNRMASVFSPSPCSCRLHRPWLGRSARRASGCALRGAIASDRPPGRQGWQAFDPRRRRTAGALPSPALAGKGQRSAHSANFAPICYRIGATGAGRTGQSATSAGSTRIGGRGSTRAAPGTQPEMETLGPFRPSCQASLGEEIHHRADSSTGGAGGAGGAGIRGAAARPDSFVDRHADRGRTRRRRQRGEDDERIRNPTTNHSITEDELVVCRGSTTIAAANRKRMNVRFGPHAAAARALPSPWRRDRTGRSLSCRQERLERQRSAKMRKGKMLRVLIGGRCGIYPLRPCCSATGQLGKEPPCAS